MDNGPLITNDAVNLGILMAILAFVFVTSHSESRFWKRFYSVIPSLFVCYFLPSVFTTLGVFDPEQSQLYWVASRYLLPASLVLLTLSIDIPGIIRLGPKAGIMFLTGTVGIVIGGPLAIILVSMINPEIVGGAGPDAVCSVCSLIVSTRRFVHCCSPKSPPSDWNDALATSSAPSSATLSPVSPSTCERNSIEKPWP